MAESDHVATAHECISDLLHEIDGRELIRIACATAGIEGEVRYRNPRIEVRALKKRAGGYIVDLAFTIETADGQVTEVWVFEVQVCFDDCKPRRWTLYLAAYENEFGVDGTLAVFTPDPDLREQIRTRQFPRVRGTIIMIERDQIERIVDYEQARARPQLAILGCLYHAHEPAPFEDRVAVVRAAWVAIQSLAIDRAVRYTIALMSVVAPNVVDQGLAELRDEGELDEYGEEILAEGLRKSYAFVKGHEMGQEEGREVLRMLVLDACELRGLILTQAQRARIEACKSLEILARWHAAINGSAANVDVDGLLR
jgi:hypothetical protein